MAWATATAIAGVLGPAQGSLFAEAPLPTPATMPQRIYGLTGEPCVVRFDTLIYSPQRGRFLYDIESGPAAQYNDYLLWRPKAGKAGGPLLLGVYSSVDFTKAATLQSSFIQSDPASITTRGKVRWLAIGDSLTKPGHYITQTVELMSQKLPGITIEPVGTQQSGKEGELSVLHEGRGGWSWVRYLEAYPPRMKWTSPFVFGPNGATDFDFTRYLREHHQGQAPEVITLFLGANDVYGIAAEFSPEKVSAILERALTVVEKIRAAAPQSVIGIIPPPPPSEQNGFGVNYGSGVTEWQYRRALQHYVAGLLQHFDGRWDERLYIIPAYLAFAPETGYPVSSGRSQNALHPTGKGFEPMSLSIGAWFAHLFAEKVIGE